MPCAPADPPLEWNDDEKECDYPELSTCPNKTPSPPADTTTASSVETTVIPDESNFTTTTEQPPSEGQTTPSEEPVETTTASEAPVETTTAEEEDNSPTTAEPLPPCGGDDTDTDDADLDLTSLCGTGCSAPRAIRNPNSDQRYVVCNGGENNDQNSVRKCGLGLVFDNSRLTCNYPGLVEKSI
jgi:hypothetical protein